MSRNVMINEDILSDIADSIRNITEESGTMKPSQMATKIGGIEKGGKLDVYVQPTAPTKKTGIWIESLQEIEYSRVELISNKLSSLNSYSKLNDLGSGNTHNFSGCSAVTVGNSVYIFGGYNDYDESVLKRAYRYDTISDTYTKLTDIPYNFYSGSAVAIGTDIYLFGSSKNNCMQKAYKFNTLTHTYTKLTDIPYNFYSGSAVAIGTDIYLFGGGSYTTRTYKYNTQTNTYQQRADIPYSFCYGSAVAIGNSIYLLGGQSAEYNNYKYDITNNRYIQLTNLPYRFYSGFAVAIGTNIYYFGGSALPTKAYIYNTSNDTYTFFNEMPFSFSSGSIAYAENTIYFIRGGANIYDRLYKYKIFNFINNCVYIAGPDNHKTLLVPNSYIYFSEAKIYLNDALQDYNCYYGNGSRWISI